MKAIFGILMIVAVGFAGLMFIPPYFSNYEFEDFLKNEALQSTYSTRSEDDIRDAVVKHAKDYDIQLTSKQVRVSRSGVNGAGNLSIEVDYSVPVNMPGYSTTLEFHPSSKNKGIF